MLSKQNYSERITKSVGIFKTRTMNKKTSYTKPVIPQRVSVGRKENSVEKLNF